jgi:6-pyruvoyltetrahydropterin/6-carboxytetrahydropterin synthase
MLQQIYPQINKDFEFSAAHRVPHESAGKCQNTHGHNYGVNLTIVGNDLDAAGFLIDFKTLKGLIHDKFDHTILNDHTDVFPIEGPLVDYHGAKYFMPTTEVVARVIWEIVQRHLNTLLHSPVCCQVYLRETSTSYVLFRPSSSDHVGIENGEQDELF